MYSISCDGALCCLQFLLQLNLWCIHQLLIKTHHVALCCLQFLEQVKARVRNRDTYNDFLKVMNLYAHEIISRNELMQLVWDLFSRTPDLVVSEESWIVCTTNCACVYVYAYACEHKSCWSGLSVAESCTLANFG
jgi:histone deacetylase complex regulatory component SIN3